MEETRPRLLLKAITYPQKTGSAPQSLLVGYESSLKQWRSYPLDLMDKSRGGKFLGAANCDNILNEQSQSH